jgi:hypothetical protein
MVHKTLSQKNPSQKRAGRVAQGTVPVLPKQNKKLEQPITGNKGFKLLLSETPLPVQPRGQEVSPSFSTISENTKWLCFYPFLL